MNRFSHFLRVFAITVFSVVSLIGPSRIVSAAPLPSESEASFSVYVVRYGDTLSGIARRYGVSVASLMQANALRSTTIYTGQRLIIPAGSPVPGDGVVQTEVQYVMTVQTMNVRSGPGYNYSIIGRLPAGRTVKVTGLSVDRSWWRILCLDGTAGSCWLLAQSGLTEPVSDRGQTDHIPVVPARVQFVMAQTDVNIRSGPGTSFGIVGLLYAGQTAQVTGASVDSQWWRVVCPDGTVGSCWITAKPHLTQPSGLSRW